ncbi:MAG: efflux RND transporter permease subunit, partial [Gammaproteobacteria bacterium]|nr:efflux RND transporter permease subunit [Gammaproteobacteria bacterium]
EESVGEFMKVLLEAVVIVLLVSFFALRLRAGLVVALTIPFVLAATFLIMNLLEIDIHRISTGALIIALGLLVDDAMIAIEMMSRKLEEGWDKFRAATYTFSHTAGPMLTGTLITAAGFLPIATAKSSTGEYTFAIFAVVTIALLVSWVAAVTVTPFLGYAFLHPHEGEDVAEEVYEGYFYRAFRAVVNACIRFRKTVIVLTVAVFVLGVMGMGLTEKQFFPSSNRLELMVELWLPEGASISSSEQQLKVLEEALANDEGVNTFVSYIGNGSPRFFLSLDQKLFRTNFSQTIVLTKDLPSREAVVERLRTLVNDMPGVRGRVSRVPLGPPVNYPVQFRVMGPEAQTLKKIADQVADVMRKNPHTLDVNVDWGERVPALNVSIDQAKARALGVSSESISNGLQGALSGITVAHFREDDQLIDIDLRGPADEGNRVDAVSSINLRTASGESIPLAQIGRVEQVFEEPILWRWSRELTITARADIVDGVQAPEVAMAINPQLEEIRSQLPPAYRIEVGGAWEENAKAETSIGAGYPLMIGITLSLLMLQLQSFSRVFIVALTAPLGIIGVALGLLIFQQPFGFVALLGTIALAGMIMRNSVILVDQIEQDRQSGIPDWIAIRESAVRRFRPIMLTAAAAILAMIPLSTSVLWGPMAFAIMGGLFVATILTLTFVPAFYAAWFRVKPLD